MIEVFRRRVINLLMARGLTDEDLTRNLLSWKHSGFGIMNSGCILDESAQGSLAEYIARPPISLGKIRYEPSKRWWEEMPWVAKPAPGGWMTTHRHGDADTDDLRRILRHLVKIGRSLPGFGPDRLN
jgi:hypothetical protein